MNGTVKGNKTRDSVVMSQTVHLNKNSSEAKDRTTVHMYPAVGVLIHTFDKNGTKKNSVTHFQPDFLSINWGSNRREATPERYAHNTVTNLINERQPEMEDSYKKQTPGSSIPWPFAGVFPIVINDPFLSVYNAFPTSVYNAVSSMVEYGPDADICRHGETRKDEESEKYLEAGKTESNVFGEVTMRSENFRRINRKPVSTLRDRLIVDAPVRRRRDATAIYLKTRQGDKVSISFKEPGGLNQKNPEESDLILRKGGIAIAGPGGAATAYTGGTAIVGPYGTVYKSPEGTAILGPFSKIVNITDDMSFEEILKLHKALQNQELNSRTGPQGNFKNFRNLFSFKTNLPVNINIQPQGRNVHPNPGNIYKLNEDDVIRTVEKVRKEEFKRIVEDTPFEEKMAKDNETTLVFRPKSKAEAGRNGVALSAPTSHAVLYPGQKTNIFFEPESVASAGPSGFAHAHSDLYVTYVPNTTFLRPPQQ